MKSIDSFSFFSSLSFLLILSIQQLPAQGNNQEERSAISQLINQMIEKSEYRIAQFNGDNWQELFALNSISSPSIERSLASTNTLNYKSCGEAPQTYDFSQMRFKTVQKDVAIPIEISSNRFAYLTPNTHLQKQNWKDFLQSTALGPALIALREMQLKPKSRIEEDKTHTMVEEWNQILFTRDLRDSINSEDLKIVPLSDECSKKWTNIFYFPLSSSKQYKGQIFVQSCFLLPHQSFCMLHLIKKRDQIPQYLNALKQFSRNTNFVFDHEIHLEELNRFENELPVSLRNIVAIENLKSKKMTKERTPSSLIEKTSRKFHRLKHKKAPETLKIPE